MCAAAVGHFPVRTDVPAVPQRRALSGAEMSTRHLSQLSCCDDETRRRKRKRRTSRERAITKEEEEEEEGNRPCRGRCVKRAGATCDRGGINDQSDGLVHDCLEQ